MSLFKSLLQIDLQVSKVAGRGLIAPTDQDIVETGGALFWKNGPGNLAQAPFGAISCDGISDLLRAREPDADAVGLAVATLAILQGKRRGRHPSGGGSGQKIGSLGEYGQSLELHD